MSVRTALLGIAVLLAPSGPAAAEPPFAGPEDAAVAAVIPEQQWAYSPKAPYLIEAAVLREVAGHYGHVAAYAGALLGLASELSEEQVIGIREMLVRALKKTVPVVVHLTMAADKAATVEVDATYGADERPPLEVSMNWPAGNPTDGWVLVYLDPGPWGIRVRVNGEVRYHSQLALVGGTPATIEVSAGPAKEPVRKRNLLALGLGVSASSLAAISVVMLGAGGNGVKRNGGEREASECVDDAANLECRTRLKNAGALRSAGAGMLGAGLGVAITALTALSNNTVRRRRAWIAEAIVGGGLSVGAVAWISVGARQLADVNEDPARRGWNEYIHKTEGIYDGHTAGSLFLGLGVGLLVGAGTALVVDRLRPRGRMGSWGGPRWAVGPGLSLSF